MSNSSPQPTAAMIEFYERRTIAHIGRVRSCLCVMAEITNYGPELLTRAEEHDASKFEPEERIPYIWLTEFHRCRRNGEFFHYPEGIAEQIELAVQHHMSVNRHHPEYHQNPDDMSEVDLIEMICDWTAMAQEFEQNGGSARGWADKVIGTRVHFGPRHRQFVYSMIELLDQHLNHVDSSSGKSC
jgi:hypothetical protein